MAKAQATFTDAKRLLHDRKGIGFGLLFPAQPQITHKGDEKEFTDPDKIMAHIKMYIIPDRYTYQV